MTASRARVLIAAQAPELVERLRDALDPGQEALAVASLEAAWDLLQGRDGADLLLLADLPDADALVVHLRADPRLQALPVIRLHDPRDAAGVSAALAAGAQDVLGAEDSLPLWRARIARALRPVPPELAEDSDWIPAVEGAEQGVWDWDIAAGRVTLSQQCRILLGDAGPELALHHGARPAELAFDAWRARIHPDDAAAAQRRLERHRLGIASGYESEHRLRCADGSHVWVQEGGRVVQHDGRGRPLRMIGTLTDISRRKDAEARAASLAWYDPVTALPNRRRLVELLRLSLAGDRLGKGGATLYLIDLDHFKLVNDAHGHDVGDQLLRQAGLRLQEALAPTDVVARMGGDEFAVLALHETRAQAQAASAASATGQRLLAALAQPYRIDERLHHCEASIGMVAVDADQAEQAEQLIKWADIALYAAKHAGRGRLRVFDPAMQAAVEARSALEAELRAAITNQEFRLHYQLQVGEGDHALGAEALVRWMHPQRGVVAPSAFIGLAEETGLIVPLGRALLEQVCAQLARWAGDPRLCRLTVAFNVSARELREPDFVDAVIETLARSGAPVRRLKLELTESSLLGDIDDIAERMQRLRAHGVGFALDDFGTGFSSLAYLKRLPFDQLKIDRSFVRDILDDHVDAHLSRAIVALAASLGLSVVAEGVELAAQGELLREFGCRQFQGFLFGEPMPADDLAATVQAVAAGAPLEADRRRPLGAAFEGRG